MEKLLNQHFVVGALTPSFPWQLLVEPEERGRGEGGIGGRKKGAICLLVLVGQEMIKSVLSVVMKWFIYVMK